MAEKYRQLKLEPKPPLHEVLRFLGYKRDRTQAPNALLDGIARQLANESPTLQAAASSVRGSCSTVTEREFLLFNALILKGKTVASVLNSASQAVIGLVTLTGNLDSRLSSLSKEGHFSEAVILDAIGSAAVETAADQFQDFIARQVCLEGLSITHRVSPGYGDFSLETQPEILSWIDASDLGVTLTSSLMLRPNKTITFLLGIGTDLQNQAPNDHCQRCPAQACVHRKN